MKQNPLHRELLDGNEFDTLFPPSQCKGTSSGNGDTDHSIKKMVEVVQKYGFQTDEIAPELQATMLDQTIANIHWFLFNHFQYKADDDEQQLRSPACSWSIRGAGIDCKSYSILASSICNSLNIKNIIRKVNYTTTPNAYSHVYVIVPIDQINNNPANGYYIIDGTLENNQELPFVTYKDQPMHHTTLNSPYYRPQLNGGFADWISNAAAGNNATINAIQGGISTVQNAPSMLDGAIDLIPYASTAKAMLSKMLGIDLSNITEALSHLDCIGGTAYETKDADADIVKILEGFKSAVDQMNIAVLNRDMNAFSNAFANHDLVIFSVESSIANRKSEGWNSCDGKNMDKVHTVVMNYINNFRYAFFDQYLASFFNFHPIGKVTISKTISAPICGLVCNTEVNFSGQLDKHAFQIKDGITTIPALEFTPEVSAAITGQGFNVNAAMNSLTKVIQVVKPIVVAVQNGGLEALQNNPYPATTTNTPANNGTASNTNAQSNSNTPANNGTPPPTQQAGFGTVGIVLVGLLALGAATMKKKN